MRKSENPPYKEDYPGNKKNKYCSLKSRNVYNWEIIYLRQDNLQTHIQRKKVIMANVYNFL